ncbi:anthrone oxygenase family protein [Plantactinospora sp. ZYX-F-223]|uniref:anthrone oxygenase family protein n=1 Tax=Plantactinospora sp. ZYX-F-223 TaxID=3144103 RepID=UPI0031FD7E66
MSLSARPLINQPAQTRLGVAMHHRAVPGRPARHQFTDALLTVAQFGQAHLFFGNLYEAVVKVPDRFAEHRDLATPPGATASLASLLRPGSPVLYFVPSGPITVAMAVGALATGWRGPNRHWLTASAAATVAMALQTAHLNRTVNRPLFLHQTEPTTAERTALLRRWYRMNAIRMATLAIGWVTARQAKTRNYDRLDAPPPMAVCRCFEQTTGSTARATRATASSCPSLESLKGLFSYPITRSHRQWLAAAMPWTNRARSAAPSASSARRTTLEGSARPRRARTRPRSSTNWSTSRARRALPSSNGWKKAMSR